MKKLTGEQAQIIQKSAAGGSIHAFAGTGKTTTLRMVCRKNPGKRYLYIAYNREMGRAAERVFPKENTEVRTMHSLAYQAVGREMLDNGHQLGNIKPFDVGKILGINNWFMAGRTLRTMRAFMQSDAPAITPAHAQEAMAQETATMTQSGLSALVDMADKVWRAMIKKNSPFHLEHDAYLKLAQLRGALDRKLSGYHLTLVDEAQDLNRVMVGILGGRRVLAVGDPYQAIYGWRGAKNTLDDFPGQKFYLTESFRFGPATADLATKLLHRFRGERKEIIGRGDTRLHPPQKDQLPDFATRHPHMRLSRGNTKLITEALRAEENAIPFHFCGGMREDIFDNILGVYGLESANREYAKRNRICQQLLKDGNGVDALKQYAKETGDNELTMAIELNARIDVVDAIARIKKRHIAHPQDAQILLLTAHRAKGLEHDNVLLLNDFTTFRIATSSPPSAAPAPYPLEEENEQEVNLLYVALTRARHNLAYNGQIQLFLDKEADHPPPPPS